MWTTQGLLRGPFFCFIVDARGGFQPHNHTQPHTQKRARGPKSARIESAIGSFQKVLLLRTNPSHHRKAMSLALFGTSVTAFTAPVIPFAHAVRATSPAVMMAGGMTRKERRAAAKGEGKGSSNADGVVVPTAGVANDKVEVQSTYDSGVMPPSTVAPESEPVVEAPSTKTAPPKPTRKADWNPEGLDVEMLPDMLKEQFVVDYLTSSPAYLDGSMPGDIGFDPWGLVALARPSEATDKFARTAKERDAEMLSLSAEEQQDRLAWMRESEIKHGRLAMLAAAGWPMAELSSSSYLHVAVDTNGRAPSLFNGHLAEFAGPLFIFAGAMAALEVRNKDKLTGGDLGFDPLGFGGKQRPAGAVPFDGVQALVDQLPYTGDKAVPKQDGSFMTPSAAMQTAEIKNGRLAMMAITGYAVQEFLWGNPVVEQTPFFFGR